MANSSADNKKSRYVNGGITEVFSTRLGWWERIIYERHRDDISYKIEPKYHNRPDLLAFDIYGSPAYMWVVLQYNNILDVNLEFIEGQTITIPSPNRVKLEMT